MYNKKFFEMICEKYDFDTAKDLIYLQYEDITESDEYGSFEETKIKLVPHEGVLEIVQYVYNSGKDEFTEEIEAITFIAYEKIIRLEIVNDRAEL